MLAGSPAALRAYARFRSELRRGTLSRTTLERISLAVADHYGSAPGIKLHLRTARQEGLGIDEVRRARDWDSGDEREAALLGLLRESLQGASPLPAHLLEEAREHDWTDEQSLGVQGIGEIARFGVRGPSPEVTRVHQVLREVVPPAVTARKRDHINDESNPEDHQQRFMRTQNRDLWRGRAETGHR